jgi:sigma-E factor negative regulatory protein RseC
MKQTGYIEHEGVVTQVKENSLYVNLINISSCSGCHVKGFCNVSDVDHKTIEIFHPDKKISKGDTVTVNYEKTLGPLALLFGYIIPFLLVVVTLVISLAITENEGISGLLSLSVLLPYYTLLFLYRNLLKTKFAFTVKKRSL